MNIQYFETLQDADNYIITDIPFVGYCAENKLIIYCNENRKKIVVNNSVMEIVTYTPPPEFVDLGLSVKWAKCNLGAETETDYGDYYAWGEVETKSDYSWATYTRHTNKTYSWGNKKAFIKYCSTSQESTYWAGTGSADNKLTLDLGADGDDIVNKLYGGNYRMPTAAEYRELLALPHVWTTKNGINGYEFTGNGNTLFLPAAGTYINSSLSDVGSDGNYWSSSLNGDVPWAGYYLDFTSRAANVNSTNRYLGYSIRPVLLS